MNRIAILNSNLTLRTDDIKSYQDFVRITNGNIGNSYIGYSMAKQLMPRYSVSISYLRNIWLDTLTQDKANELNRDFDFAILIMQDQIRDGFSDDIFARALKSIEKVDIPLCVVSLGVNTVTNQSIDEINAALGQSQRAFLDCALTKALCIGVRGAKTLEMMKRWGHAQKSYAIGCPSFYETGSNLPLHSKRWSLRKSIIATGLHSSKEPLFFILQSEQDEITKALASEKLTTFPESSYPGFTASYRKAFERRRVLFFTNLNSWKAFLRRKGNIVLGTRIHGAVAALNSGVPAIVTSGDLRSEEMCGHLLLPYRRGACGLDINAREEFEKYPHEAMQENYQRRWKEYVGFFQDLGIVIDASPHRLPISGAGRYIVRA
jgi:hypothetical protein